MEKFTAIVISILAALVGVRADVTFWMTSTATETAWATKALPASTMWSTETYTQTAWSTYTPPAVTVSIPYTETSVLEKDYTQTLTWTVEKDYTTTVTQTSLSVSVVASLATKYSAYTTTATSVVVSVTTVYVVQSGPTITQVCTPVTVKQPTTITIPPTTVTAPPVTTTASLTGLVTCPSRTINPTYTTSTQLPDEYTWGCPPGYICHPPQINCNFEQNPPADTYYCAPDECVSAPPVASFNQTGPGCGPYQTFPDYFNFDPELFGLSFSIFVDGGNYAETCSSSSCAMSTLAPVSQISDGQPQAPTLVPVCQLSDGQPQAPAYTATWGPVTTIADGQPEGPVITTPPRLARRQLNVPLPQVCYEDCNICLDVGIRDGKSKCCPADSPFSSAYELCSQCLSSHRSDTRTDATALLPSLEAYVSYCNSEKNVAAPISTVAVTTTSAPPPTSSPTSATASTTISATPPSTPIITLPSSTTSSSTLAASISSSITSSPPAVACVVSQISDGQPQACTNASTTTVATFSGAASHAFPRPSLWWSSPFGWILLLLANTLG